MGASSDESFMATALRLARKGLGFVSPNPLVGAVVVRGGKIVGRGYHARFGGPHAEVVALNEAGEEANGATLYVTLEPCAHQGKTPPCVDAIVEAGVARVVAGMRDPNPLVNGKGIEALSKRGIAVTVGVCEEECRRLNEAYLKYITTGMPFVTLKIAQSLDGKIATAAGHSKWISCERARALVRKLRAQYDAILVGAGTVCTDDPVLTPLDKSGPIPKRVVVDDQLAIPLDARLLTDEYATKTVVVTTTLASSEKIRRIEERGAKVLVLEPTNGERISFDTLWHSLAQMQVASVLVEGGQQVFTEALLSGQVDRVLIFVAPKLLGEGLDALGDLGIRNVNAAIEIADVSVKKVGSTFLFSGRPVRKA
ncbi:MAG: bifunctional diaminohydroxyphosphoribosylaminopyrimidine deaminase/5-amino-6-(5-phosphoribosylamino)uracil reductase RibD [candidate division KSB1 bacterium]|nr:bifunctional diaminohydroxyphosphoribosylaminopyrimidine deaminase/5-amino-6-(5-phosphoribosylamino)uracil reductase RibD [candidate division KSB1 bacterium]